MPAGSTSTRSHGPRTSATPAGARSAPSIGPTCTRRVVKSSPARAAFATRKVSPGTPSSRSASAVSAGDPARARGSDEPGPAVCHFRPSKRVAMAPLSFWGKPVHTRSTTRGESRSSSTSPSPVSREKPVSASGKAARAAAWITLGWSHGRNQAIVHVKAEATRAKMAKRETRASTPEAGPAPRAAASHTTADRATRPTLAFTDVPFWEVASTRMPRAAGTAVRAGDQIPRPASDNAASNARP